MNSSENPIKRLKKFVKALLMSDVADLLYQKCLRRKTHHCNCRKDFKKITIPTAIKTFALLSVQTVV